MITETILAADEENELSEWQITATGEIVYLPIGALLN